MGVERICCWYVHQEIYFGQIALIKADWILIIYIILDSKFWNPTISDILNSSTTSQLFLKICHSKYHSKSLKSVRTSKFRKIMKNTKMDKPNSSINRFM